MEPEFWMIARVPRSSAREVQDFQNEQRPDVISSNLTQRSRQSQLNRNRKTLTTE